jgi:hypothetical protein
MAKFGGKRVCQPGFGCRCYNAGLFLMKNRNDMVNIHLISLDVISAAAISEAIEGVTVKTGGTLDYLSDQQRWPAFDGASTQNRLGQCQINL